MGIIFSAIGTAVGTAIFGTYFFPYFASSTGVALGLVLGLLAGILSGYQAVARARWWLSEAQQRPIAVVKLLDWVVKLAGSTYPPLW
jgi:hypothetical protein